jgi:putative flippase GtrA
VHKAGWQQWLLRFIKFKLIGLGVLVLGIGLTFVLVEWLETPAWLAYAIQAIVSISVKFYLNRRITWPDRRVSMPVAFGRFLLTRVVTVTFNQALFNVLVWASRVLPAWQYWYLVAQVTCTVVVALIDFKLLDVWVFRALTHHEPPQQPDNDQGRQNDGA